MSENTSARNPGEGEAPLLPGGEPELAGTGPKGAYPDGSPSPGQPVAGESNVGLTHDETTHDDDES